MNRRGFTLIELAITLVIIAVLAAATIASFEARTRNASVETTAMDLVAQAQALRFRALSEQTDYLFVVASPTANDATRCGMLQAGNCVQAFILRNPTAAWTVLNFAADVTALCKGGRTCLAVRFSATGEVKAEYVAAPGPSVGGAAIGITSDLAGLSRAAQHRGVFISFPSGTVRTWPY